MRMMRQGFTLIEVSLVLMITTLLFIAFASSIAPALRARRFADSAENFAEFLRSVYSSVTNVQNNGYGTSKEQAIYGKLVTFYELGPSDQKIRVYDVLGDALRSNQMPSGTSTLQSLERVHVSVYYYNDGSFVYEAGSGVDIYENGEIINQRDYELTNGAWLEPVDVLDIGSSLTKISGALLIVRSPISGTVTTYYREKTLGILEAPVATDRLPTKNPLMTAIQATLGTAGVAVGDDEKFESVQVDFCVASDDQSNPGHRRDVRVLANGGGTAAVQLLSLDAEDNRCLK